MGAPKGNTYAMKYTPSMDASLMEYARRRVEDGKYPTIYGWCAEQGISSATVTTWIDKNSAQYHQSFCTAHAQFVEFCRDLLVSGALSEEYNAQFAKFVASACLGLVEKAAQDTTMTVQVKVSKEIEEEAQ